MAVIASGVSCSLCSRNWAVTKISCSPCPEVVSCAVVVVSCVVSFWANAGDAAAMLISEAEAARKAPRHREPDLFMIFPSHRTATRLFFSCGNPRSESDATYVCVTYNAESRRGVQFRRL
jgi:hypothetical protein